MKLIVSPLRALRSYVSREFFYVMKELIDKYGWQQMETNSFRDGRRTMKEILLEELGELPEVILFWEGYDTLALHARNVRQLDCKRYILADDLHWWSELMRQRKLVSFAFCHAVLSTYGYAWEKFYPALAGFKRVVWVPHSASPDFLMPYNPDPLNSILLSGAVSAHYPLRRQMKSLHERGVYPVAYHEHPGYHCGYDYEQKNGNVGRSYAERINRHRAAFTDSLSFKYVVAKYFEIPATGALLLADDAVSGPLERLGFIGGRHYLPVSKENLEERVRYVLDERNRAEVDEIRRRGQELVWARHRTSDRARQINEVCAA